MELRRWSFSSDSLSCSVGLFRRIRASFAVIELSELVSVADLSAADCGFCTGWDEGRPPDDAALCCNAELSVAVVLATRVDVNEDVGALVEVMVWERVVEVMVWERAVEVTVWERVVEVTV